MILFAGAVVRSGSMPYAVMVVLWQAMVEESDGLPFFGCYGRRGNLWNRCGRSGRSGRRRWCDGSANGAKRSAALMWFHFAEQRYRRSGMKA